MTAKSSFLKTHFAPEPKSDLLGVPSRFFLSSGRFGEWFKHH